LKTDVEALAAACCRGETEAFGALFDALRTPIFNIAYRMVGDQDDASDICQTTFIKAFQSIHDYDPRYKFFSWIYRIAVNESINHVKRNARRAPLPEDEPAAGRSPDEDAHGHELGAIIQKALMRLTERQRALVILRHFRGCTYRQMAHILEIPDSTVKSDLYTARQRLQEVLTAAGARPW
jgi:RNA polymerase sigma-70 factor (ECF subfamily)